MPPPSAWSLRFVFVLPPDPPRTRGNESSPQYCGTLVTCKGGPMRDSLHLFNLSLRRRQQPRHHPRPPRPHHHPDPRHRLPPRHPGRSPGADHPGIRDGIRGVAKYDKSICFEKAGRSRLAILDAILRSTANTCPGDWGRRQAATSRNLAGLAFLRRRPGEGSGQRRSRKATKRNRGAFPSVFSLPRDRSGLILTRLSATAGEPCWRNRDHIMGAAVPL
jgi:hypothetical protein